MKITREINEEEALNAEGLEKYSEPGKGARGNIQCSCAWALRLQKYGRKILMTWELIHCRTPFDRPI